MMKKKDIELEFGHEKYMKLEKEFREKQPWLFSKPQEIFIEKENPPILVYQMGKVGSTSVVASLKEAGISNPVYHVHQLRYYKLKSRIKKNIKRLNENRKRRDLDGHFRMYRHLYLNYLIRQLESHILLRKKLDENFNEISWKVITLVRDPIMRQISGFFFNFHNRPELLDEKGQFLKEKSMKALKHQVIKRLIRPWNWSLRWFDREFKEVLKVDPYKFPFNHDKGYSFIYTKNLSILIIKLEKLNQCFPEAIYKFINKNDLQLIKRNIAEKKFYYNAYKYVVNNIAFGYKFCKRVYSSKFIKHFYSKDEIENFIMKWTRGRL